MTPGSEARPPGFISLRVRLLGLVLLVLIPWLVFVLYTQADERRAAIAGVKRDDAPRRASISSPYMSPSTRPARSASGPSYGPRSMRATLYPRPARNHAAADPVRPPPRMEMSQEVSLSSGGRGT